MKRSLKDSGLSWIGQVPADWVIIPTRAALRSRKDEVGAAWAQTPLLSLTKQGVIPRDINGGEGKFPASFEGYQLLEPDDLVFCLFDMDETPRTVGRATRTGMITGAYTRFVVDTNVAEPRFLEWYYLAIDSEKRFRPLYSGLRKVVQKPRFLAAGLALPGLAEQRAIADYLDRETARIDTLIEEQQHLIEMLRGRRKAVVEQAVFSGLDNVPTTGNPEPWLPDTPAPWTVVQLGFLSDTLAGYAFPSDGFSADEEHVPLLRGVNVKPGLVDWSDVVYWDAQTRPVPVEYDLKAGDLVFGMDRPFVAAGVRVAPVADNDLPALLLQRVMRIRSSESVNGSYLRYVVGTDAFLDYLEPLFTGVSVPHVSEWQVRKFKMPCPPLDEQGRIAEHLDLQTAKIDELVLESERFIELSRERRAALITSAVTGQIDVREVA